jgi:hypothetical protein
MIELLQDSVAVAFRQPAIEVFRRIDKKARGTKFVQGSNRWEVHEKQGAAFLYMFDAGQGCVAVFTWTGQGPAVYSAITSLEQAKDKFGGMSTGLSSTEEFDDLPLINPLTV